MIRTVIATFFMLLSLGIKAQFGSFLLETPNGKARHLVDTPKSLYAYLGQNIYTEDLAYKIKTQLGISRALLVTSGLSLASIPFSVNRRSNESELTLFLLTFCASIFGYYYLKKAAKKNARQAVNIYNETIWEFNEDHSSVLLFPSNNGFGLTIAF